MHFIWNSSSLGIADLIIQSILILVLYAFVSFIVVISIKRRRAMGFYYGLIGLSILAYIFDFLYLFIGANFVLILMLFCMFLVNIGDIRKFIANPFYKPTSTKDKVTVDKLIDKKSLFAKVESAVETLSKSRIGAIITFERNTSLREICKNGVAVNAPVTSELLLTIFYPGTRLHDGAVVIRRDEILAASVYYTPTTRPLTGKFGSRHRAGIGISELTDAVTVIVSEETGRISITYKGELIPVQQDNLLRTLEDYLINEPDEGSEEEEK